MMKIISGGQTGVDRGALDAALDVGAPCGGWCPPGRKAEDGRIPLHYPLQEMPTGSYRHRTRRNVEHSDATLILHFGELEGGTLETENFCRQQAKPHLVVDVGTMDVDSAVREIIGFITDVQVETLNVAGPRASKQPQAAELTRQIIRAVLQKFHDL